MFIAWFFSHVPYIYSLSLIPTILHYLSSTIYSLFLGAGHISVFLSLKLIRSGRGSISVVMKGEHLKSEKLARLTKYETLGKWFKL